MSVCFVSLALTRRAWACTCFHLLVHRCRLMLRALALRARTRSLPRSVRRLHLVQFSVAGGNNANGRPKKRTTTTTELREGEAISVSRRPESSCGRASLARFGFYGSCRGRGERRGGFSSVLASSTDCSNSKRRENSQKTEICAVDDRGRRRCVCSLC